MAPRPCSWRTTTWLPRPPRGGPIPRSPPSSSARATNSCIWGRGTLDDKGSLVAVLEGVEANILAGHTPEHDVYLSFGHDEETAGSGAKAIVDLLESRDVSPGLVIDEGGAVVEGVFPGVTDPIAVVGTSEKGILSLLLTVDQHGGHASTPPRVTATVRLARAIVRAEPHGRSGPASPRPRSR